VSAPARRAPSPGGVRLILAVALALGVGAGTPGGPCGPVPGARAGVIVDLEALGGGLPFALADSVDYRTRYPEHEGRVLRLADLDGDGYPELAEFTGRGVVASDLGAGAPQAIWQVNLPVDLIWPEPGLLAPGASLFCDLGLVADLDQDGLDELVLTAATPDRTAWSLHVVDPRTQRRVLDLALPVGDDRNGDGAWDGEWDATGVLPAGQAGPNPCLVLTARVGYDAHPRGFTALDVITGEPVWQLTVGGNPSLHQAWLGDLEGDGRWELVATTGAPDNLGGERFAGMSDDRSWVIVVAADGELRHRRALDGITSHSQLHVADLDGDGTAEILLATAKVGAGERETLRVLDPLLRPLVRTFIPGGCQGLSAAARPDGSAHIYVATYTGLLGRYRYSQGRLDPPIEAATSTPLELLEHADLLPAAGDELLLAAADRHRLLVLDEDLTPLLDTGPLPAWAQQALIWRPTTADCYLATVGREHRLGRIVAVARPAPWRQAWTQLLLVPLPVVLLILAPAILLTAAATVGALRHRRRHARDRDVTHEPSPPSRDALAQLLFDLEQSSHGAVAVNRGLRRLLTLLSGLAGGLPADDQLRRHIRRTCEVTRESDLPAIAEILARARTATCDAGVLADLARAHAALAAELDALLAEDLAPAVVGTRLTALRQAYQALEAGLQELREELEAEFSCDLAAVLERVLWAREFELDREAITVEHPDLASGDWRVLAEPRDLRFVLDNLLGNAIEAMTTTTRRILTIELTRRQNAVVCRVTDTGPGIPSELHDQLFKARVSSRSGGGLGLFRSQQMLARWGGRIEVETTGAGRGTTFRVQVPAAAPRLRLITPDEQAVI